jgi:hypothetical protein
LVYPAPDHTGRWIVEAPAASSEQEHASTQFSGPHAMDLALRYAYEQFGSARFFPF